ncbi:hypothetical protein [Klebsiella aerogenes]|uniref:hypothetical protein n=1 Tax=Klebsiella aerogenes TaxID=548 RepID=UPI000DA158D3|nr:hypothetical protein [Klebsiella aerogenes]HCB2859847.1 hypothetical protein [Klebsiella aerogenes]HCB2864850.1 hypothetical protein [Klebsiella aerogenes]HCB2880478.1 hypothetical protein [Klebsiella aerogenes]HCB3345913.1 hypothetical protein [Klebsiella aerogenes]HCM1811915.1 hypothetical protein [Klebsiella aerogenes]
MRSTLIHAIQSRFLLNGCAGMNNSHGESESRGMAMEGANAMACRTESPNAGADFGLFRTIHRELPFPSCGQLQPYLSQSEREEPGRYYFTFGEGGGPAGGKSFLIQPLLQQALSGPPLAWTLPPGDIPLITASAGETRNPDGEKHHA